MEINMKISFDLSVKDIKYSLDVTYVILVNCLAHSVSELKLRSVDPMLNTAETPDTYQHQTYPKQNQIWLNQPKTDRMVDIVAIK